MNTDTHKTKSLILECSCDIATMLTAKDWGETRSGMYVSDGANGTRFSEEAQGMFNDHLDVVEDKITNMVKQIDNG